MSDSFEIISIIAPAFVAGVVIALAHVPLGVEVLKRGIIFLDLAVAQVAALGMVVFHTFLKCYDMPALLTNFGALFLGLIFALVCALGLYKLERFSKHFQEAIIGSVFILAASASILIVSSDPHGGETIKDILSGQILWITWKELILYAPVFITTTCIWMFYKELYPYLFYILFALIVPLSVNLIGVYLVFASLILPALATINIKKYRYIIAYVISVLSFALGLYISYVYDTPSGVTIVMALFVISFCYFVIVKYKHI